MEDERTKMQGKPINEFTDLIVWQKGHSLCVALYKVTQAFPQEEIFGITSQIRRSSSSVTANIAEGFGRKTAKDQLHFYYQANGSLLELRSHLLLSRDIGYLTEDKWDFLNGKAVEVHKLLSGLIKTHTNRL